MSDRLRRTDAQVHAGGKYRPIEELRTELDAHGVGQAVLVQHAGNADNSYLQHCVESDRRRFAGVALVTRPEQVATIAATGAFSGVRIPAGFRSPGPDPVAIWRSLARHDLVATVQGPYQDIADRSFADILDALPELPVVLEHVGNFRYGGDFRGFLRLATRPNVHVMWSCFYRFSSSPYPHRDAWSFLQETLAAFGSSRIMWSGDLNRFEQGLAETDEDYARAIALLDRLLEPLSEDDRQWIRWRTAHSVYGLDQP
jgi:predicted TIM-barrel fold metal-dependent hydrolase